MPSGAAHKAQAEQRKADAEARKAKLREAEQAEEQLEARAAAARQNQDVPRLLVLNGDIIHSAVDFHKELYAQGVGSSWRGCDHKRLHQLLDDMGPFALRIENSSPWSSVPGILMSTLMSHPEMVDWWPD